jgi:post-segregation antitoxin (ccd killing protein)
LKALKKPAFGQNDVFTACIKGIADTGTSARINTINPQLLQQERTYDQMASTGQLDRWPAHPRGHNHLPALGVVSRGEFKGLYTDQMARAGKPARNYYDQLRVSAPGNVCPYCGIGVVETLDHFLPKGCYSTLSILPLNLVPACRDCNTGKLGGVMTADTMTLHPYFEDASLSTDEWLFATIVNAQVVHVKFRAMTPAAWPAAVSQRVINHVSEFDLARRYGIQAAARLTYYADYINRLKTSGVGHAISELLRFNVQAEVRSYGVNSWQAALAKAVADDEWFTSRGYAQFL